VVGLALVSQAPADQSAIAALGRLEPKDGVFTIAGPSRPAIVITKLEVDEGDAVRQGQVIAVLDSLTAQQALIDRLQAELDSAEAEHKRSADLFKKGFASESERDAWRTRLEVARANLRQAQAELEYSVVRSPIDGQVLTIHTRAGERVGADGIAELARTSQMYAVAEVYETDITKVRVGQKATISTTALATPLTGTVERIGMKIGKRDVLATDPAADTDARVVEVHIRLDDSAPVAGLTNLKVEVRIELGSIQP
jgi:HlyD family secretion protein